MITINKMNKDNALFVTKSLNTLYDYANREKLILRGYNRFYKLRRFESDIKKLIDKRITKRNNKNSIDWFMKHFYNEETKLLDFEMAELFTIFYYLNDKDIFKIIYPEIDEYKKFCDSYLTNVKDCINKYGNKSDIKTLEEMKPHITSNAIYYDILFNERSKELLKFYKENNIDKSILDFYHVDIQ